MNKDYILDLNIQKNNSNNENEYPLSTAMALFAFLRVLGGSDDILSINSNIKETNPINLMCLQKYFNYEPIPDPIPETVPETDPEIMPETVQNPDSELSKKNNIFSKKNIIKIVAGIIICILLFIIKIPSSLKILLLVLIGVVYFIHI